MTEYPSEQDCEAMLTVSNAFDNLSTWQLTAGYAAFVKRIKSEDSDQAQENWMKLWMDCFGPKSPWSYRINPKTKNKTHYWNESKAQELGILTTT